MGTVETSAAMVACAAAAAAGYALALCTGAKSTLGQTAPRVAQVMPPAAARPVAPSEPAVEVTNPTIVALVPMKHTSLRVPGKNYRKLGDRPLCCWVLQTLCDCDRISQVVVDTDSDTVKAMLREQFPQIQIIDRPAHLLNDPPMNEILLYDTGVVKADFYFQTHVTNPFLKKETINAALDSFLSQYPYQCDSLFAVRQWQTRLYDQLGNAVRATRQPLHRSSCCVPRLAGRRCVELYSAAKGHCCVRAAGEPQPQHAAPHAGLAAYLRRKFLHVCVDARIQSTRQSSPPCLCLTSC